MRTMVHGMHRRVVRELKQRERCSIRSTYSHPRPTRMARIIFAPVRACTHNRSLQLPLCRRTGGRVPAKDEQAASQLVHAAADALAEVRRVPVSRQLLAAGSGWEAQSREQEEGEEAAMPARVARGDTAHRLHCGGTRLHVNIAAATNYRARPQKITQHLLIIQTAKV